MNKFCKFCAIMFKRKYFLLKIKRITNFKQFYPQVETTITYIRSNSKIKNKINKIILSLTGTDVLQYNKVLFIRNRCNKFLTYKEYVEYFIN